MKPDAPTRLTRALRIADQTPEPRDIARRIMQASPGAHNGLRAASYDGKVKGGSSGSHPERLAEIRDPAFATEKKGKPTAKPNAAATELDHLRKVSKAGLDAMDAIAALNAECADGGSPDTWDEALKTATKLLEPIHPNQPADPGEAAEWRKVHPSNCTCVSLMRAADEVGRELGVWVDRFDRAVKDLRKLHQRYQPRPATRWEQIRESGIRADEICDICASLDPPVYIAVRNKAFLLCRHCNDLRLEHGERPTRDVKQAFHHGSQLDYRRALSRWAEDCIAERRAHHA
jgi:hypothetical protein